MQKNDTQIYALIYNRVSSSQQEKDGSGLVSQEQRCIKYAESKGYEVEKIFHDTFTGGGDFMKRPAMRELLLYIDGNPGKSFVVIFDDLKRFARDTKFHIELRGAFNLRKAAVECLNFKFEDTPEGTFVETILAAQNQLEREQNKRQVIQKQKSRLESGHWSFPASVGYTMKKQLGFTGKILVPNEKAPILKEALEGFSTLRFTHLTEMAQFLKDNGVYGKRDKGKYIDAVRLLISNPLYAGYIEYVPWGVSKRKGIHQAIISHATFLKNQQRINSPSHVTRISRDRNAEFELRRLVNCIHCGNPFTSCFSKGKYKLYPYYLCQKKGCIMDGKSAARNVIDTSFKEMLDALKPSPKVIKTFEQEFEKCWQEAVNKVNNNEVFNAEEIEKTETEIAKYTDLAGETTSAVVRTRYEEKIELLADKLELLKQKNEIPIDLSIPYRTSFDKVMQMAKNPYESWKSTELPDKKKLFYFFFDSNILYDIKTGYRTSNPSVLYRFFEDLAKNSGNVEMARNLSNYFPDVLQFIKNWA